MNPFPIDDYAYTNRLRFIHPGEKILFAGITLAICFIAGRWLVAGAAALLMIAVIWRVAGIPLAALWRFLQVPLGFIVLGVLSIVVSFAAAADAQQAHRALLWLPIGPVAVFATVDTVAQGWRVLWVSSAAVLCTLFLGLTTPMVDLMAQLRRWHVPAFFVELMMLVYRFVFVLLETAHDMYVAQDARLGHTTIPVRLRSTGMLVSNLYLRALFRAQQLFTCLSARGYTGNLTVLEPAYRWSPRRLALIGGATASLIALAFLVT